MQTKVFVRNVSANTTESHLHELFGVYGAVLNINISQDVSGHGRGFAFVEMETQVAAEAAIRSLDMREFNGRQLSMRLADTSKKKPGGMRGRNRR
jgi:RNA recognition motif-containing protein